MIEFYDLEILFDCVRKLFKLKNKLNDVEQKNLVDIPLIYSLQALQILLNIYEKETKK